MGICKGWRDTTSRKWQLTSWRLATCTHLKHKSVSTLTIWVYATANVIHPHRFDKVAAHANANIDFKTLDMDWRLNLLWAYEKAEKAWKK